MDDQSERRSAQRTHNRPTRSPRLKPPLTRSSYLRDRDGGGPRFFTALGPSARLGPPDHATLGLPFHAALFDRGLSPTNARWAPVSVALLAPEFNPPRDDHKSPAEERAAQASDNERGNMVHARS
jgi:hypothetical protein